MEGPVMSEDTKGKVSPETVVAFREAHKLDQASLDRLLGFSSGGRATRRWEAKGAPAYVGVLFAYADLYGLQIMEDLARMREGDLGPVDPSHKNP